MAEETVASKQNGTTLAQEGEEKKKRMKHTMNRSKRKGKDKHSSE